MVSPGSLPIAIGDVGCTCPTSWGMSTADPAEIARAISLSMCDQCRRRITETQIAIVPYVADVVISAGMISAGAIIDGSHTPPLILSNDSTNVEAAMQRLAESIGARIGANGLDPDNAAANDAWQLAHAKLQGLWRAVRLAVIAEAALKPASGKE